MSSSKTRKLVQAALLAAVYTTLTLVMGTLSFGFDTGLGFIQLRVAEAMTLLPVFSPTAIVGVTLGCALSNAVGFSMGLNILGAYDILFGTAATLIASILTYYLRKVRIKNVPFLAALPPILVNAVIIGLELTWMLSGRFVAQVFWIQAAGVAVGQTIACIGLGIPMVAMMEKTGFSKKFL